MKKRYYLGAALCIAIAGNVQAQSMAEDFESWAVGSYMGTNSGPWTTWTGTTGGAEDCQINTSQASSGTKSVYFSSTSSTGGPQDVLVDFGGEHNTGDFNWDANFYVDNNQGAYFNFQANTTPGLIWSFNCQMHNNGDITFDDGNGVWLKTTYPSATWFNIEIDVDLNSNTWEVLIDGASQGHYQAFNGQIATIDLFPVNSADGGNNNSSFYVDDFNFTHTPFALPSENGSPSYITGVSGLAGGNLSPTVTVRNLGSTAITSFDLEIDYDGAQITENVTGVNIASMGTTDVIFAGTITLVSGANDLTATISNVNGNGADGNTADDAKILTLNPLVPAPGKMVVGEEATGTWCQWCPRGAVFMDYMESTYDGFWAGIAVHNGDPMVNTEYDTGIGSLIGGYPSALVDRGPEIDPLALENDFIQRVVIAPDVYITNGATYNSGTGELEISMTTEFVNTVAGNWKVVCVVTEDGVTGTTGYSQSNAYAGGGSGVMGGYEILGNPVPASQMVYDHVARDIQPSFGGMVNAFPTKTAGTIYSHNFSVTLDPSWDAANMHIVCFVINSAGDIENADRTTIAEAETNGFQPEGPIGFEAYDADKNINMYPNPATDNTIVYAEGLDNDEVMIQVFDINGKLVFTENYGQLTGSVNFPINTAALQAGIYTVQTIIGESQKIEKLIVE